LTGFLLLRHAAHDNVGAFLAGRMPGVLLGEAGRAQAARLAQRLKREPIAALYCSPRERTRQTAEAVAAASSLAAPQVLEALDEIDFGHWSGQTFQQLDADESWRAWNASRSAAVTAGGERFADVGRRVTEAMEMLCRRHGAVTLGLVTHADVVKAAVLHHLGLGADDWWRIEVSPASITRLVYEGDRVRLLGLNEVID
jgi:broad specificity phosphatase PhoE